MAPNKMGITEETVAVVLVKKRLHKKIPPFYSGGVQRNVYFDSLGYYGECGKISCMKTIGDFGTRCYGLRSSAGVDFKI